MTKRTPSFCLAAPLLPFRNTILRTALPFFPSTARAFNGHRLYAALKFGGVTVGTTVLLARGLYVRLETSFDKWLPRHEGIYVVQTVWSLPESSVNGAYPWAQLRDRRCRRVAHCVRRTVTARSADADGQHGAHR